MRFLRYGAESLGPIQVIRLSTTRIGLGHVRQADRRHLGEDPVAGGKRQFPARNDRLLRSIRIGKTRLNRSKAHYELSDLVYPGGCRGSRAAGACLMSATERRRGPTPVRTMLK